MDGLLDGMLWHVTGYDIFDNFAEVSKIVDAGATNKPKFTKKT